MTWPDRARTCAAAARSAITDNHHSTLMAALAGRKWLTTGEVREICHLSDNGVRALLNRLATSGRAERIRHGCWHVKDRGTADNTPTENA